ncbi:hypothetical protein HMI56_001251, partial [Coelomomyces lativittatus]
MLAILLGLKKLQRFLIGQRFELRSDSRTIVAYLKNAGGVPDVMIMKWVAYAQMYNVEIEHIPREENFLADALTKLGRYCSRIDKEDIKKYITNKLEKVQMITTMPNALNDYDEEHKRIILFLIMGVIPNGLNIKTKE